MYTYSIVNTLVNIWKWSNLRHCLKNGQSCLVGNSEKIKKSKGKTTEITFCISETNETLEF